MEEIWTHWHPFENISGKYYSYQVSENKNGLSITISEEDNINTEIKMNFNRGVTSYRQTNELFRCHLVHNLCTKYEKYFYGWSFFKVTNSPYLKWLSAQSGSMTDQMNLTHFVIFDSDTVLDIIADYEPEIERING